MLIPNLDDNDLFHGGAFALRVGALRRAMLQHRASIATHPQDKGAPMELKVLSIPRDFALEGKEWHCQIKLA